FDTGDLSGKAQARLSFKPQSIVQNLRAVEKGVAVKPAESCKFCRLEPRDASEDAHLLAMLELRLEADDVVERAELVVLAQLYDRIGLDIRLMRIGEAARLHRPVAQGFRSALGHDLDRQAAIEIGRRCLPFLEVGLLALDQRPDEGLILLAVHRAVDIVLAG